MESTSLPAHPPGHLPATLRMPSPCTSPCRSLATEMTGATEPLSSSAMCAAMSRGVGCSNTRVAESGSPVSARSRMDSSVAASESIPASMSGVPALASPAPASSFTTPRTSASRRDCCSESDSVASTRSGSFGVASATFATAATDVTNSTNACWLSSGAARCSCRSPYGSGEVTRPDISIRPARNTAY